MSTRGLSIRGVVFDKDGTLVDFHQTWDRAVLTTIESLCEDAEDRKGLAEAIGFDLEHQRILEGSPFIAESAATLDLLIGPFADPRRFEDQVIAAGVDNVVALDGAIEVVEALAAAQIPMAIATNDSADSARRQFERLGIAHHFAGFFGYDSGYGPKPEPGMVVAAAQHLGVPIGEVAMVGDSFTDVFSGQAAGAYVVYLAEDAADAAYPETADSALVEASDLVITRLTELLQLLP